MARKNCHHHKPQPSNKTKPVTIGHFGVMYIDPQLGLCRALWVGGRSDENKE